MRLVPELWTVTIPPKPEPPRYRRRDPEATVLHRIVREHWNSFRQRLRDQGRPLSAFVERTFRRFLSCGVLARGFWRRRCDKCGRERLVAFSCGMRGWCPSCCGRKMAETAAHLVDRVFPHDVPVRQWVLTLPWRLRLSVAYDHDLELAVLRAYLGTLFEWYEQRAGRLGMQGARCGAVTYVQRFAGDLRLNPHFHSLLVDGVFTREPDEAPVFHELPPPTDAEVADLVAEVSRRVGLLLDERGLSDADGLGEAFQELLWEEPALASLGAAAAQGTVALGPMQGFPQPRVRVEGFSPTARPKGRRCAEAEGYNLHANVSIKAGDRERLERVCRYIARPPLSNSRLTQLDDGRVALQLRHMFSDGSTHVVFEPHELLARLCALVPRPWKNALHYAGVFAGNCKWRAAIVPTPPADESNAPRRKSAGGGRIPWADLLWRVFRIDATRCPCGGTFEPIAEIHDPDVIVAILDCLGLPSTPKPIAPARPPPDEDEKVGWAA